MEQPWSGSQCHLHPTRVFDCFEPVQHSHIRPVLGQALIAVGCHSNLKQPASCHAGVTGDTQMSWLEGAQCVLPLQPQPHQAPDRERLSPRGGVIYFFSMERTLSWGEMRSLQGGREGNAPLSPLSSQSAFVLSVPYERDPSIPALVT